MMKHTKYRIAIALALATGLSAFADTADAAKTLPHDVLGRVLQNAAIAPRFEPAAPTKLDEFAPDDHLKSVHFAFDKAALGSSQAAILDRDARWLRANAPYEIVIEAYADERGSKPYNVALARQRALAVKGKLVARGIQPDRIALVSYGEARPECHAAVKTEACFSKNRRADIMIRRAPAQTP